jgi:haloacetate dehalogenase
MGLIANTLEPPGLTHARAEFGKVWLHYVRGGDNEAAPLVLLHGFPQSWLMWRHILPDLMARHHIIAVDLRGYGDSAKPAGEEGYDKGTMAADIHALLDHLGIVRPVIIGHDRGARVTRRYALDYPDAVRGVALLDILPVEYIYDRLTAAEAAVRYWPSCARRARTTD